MLDSLEMKTNKSEELFETYLQDHNMNFEKAYPVNNKNVDFYIKSERGNVFCDVKEVRHSKKNEIDAYDYIRKDIQKLREKFKNKRPSEPALLVTFNFSSQFFTGYTVARAMLGDIGITYNKVTIETSDLHFLPKGNAKLTSKHNRVISGVFIFQENNNHYLFKNPFAENPIADNYFPATSIIEIDRSLDNNNIMKLTNIHIWSY